MRVTMRSKTLLRLGPPVPDDFVINHERIAAHERLKHIEETALKKIATHFAAGIAALAACSRAWCVPAPAAAGDPPIRIGSTLRSGPWPRLPWSNSSWAKSTSSSCCGGLLGRPVEWIVKDDQSKPNPAHALRAAHHRRQGRPLLGPYATGAILPPWASPSGTTRCSSTTHWHSQPRQIRRAVSDVVAGLDPATAFQTRSSMRWPRRRSRRRPSPSSPASFLPCTSCIARREG